MELHFFPSKNSIITAAVCGRRANYLSHFPVFFNSLTFPINYFLLVCGRNEVLVTDCPQPQECEKCSNVDGVCLTVCAEAPACRCAKGFCRNGDGSCVPVKKGE